MRLLNFSLVFEKPTRIFCHIQVHMVKPNSCIKVWKTLSHVKFIFARFWCLVKKEKGKINHRKMNKFSMSLLTNQNSCCNSSSCKGHTISYNSLSWSWFFLNMHLSLVVYFDQRLGAACTLQMPVEICLIHVF